MDFNQNPMLKRSVSKLMTYVLIFVILEGCAIFGMAQLIGGIETFWAIIGMMLIGYAIKPGDVAGKKKPEMSSSYVVRKLVGTLFMIPGFLSSLIGILVAIKPIRSFAQRKILQKILPPGMAENLGSDFFGNLNQKMNLDGMNPDFSHFDFNSATNGRATKDMDPRKPDKKKSKKKRKSGDVIDIDYEVEGGNRRAEGETVVEVEREVKKKKVPKQLTADVIDVEHEWKE